MIKLTYSQVMNFNSPVITKLLSSEDRKFPVDDALRLADMIDQIQPKTKLYQDQAKKIIESGGGNIGPDGRVTYANEADQVIVGAELAKLNNVEIEITGSKITDRSRWPDLNIHEAMILKPLISVNGDSNAEKNGEGS